MRFAAFLLFVSGLVALAVALYAPTGANFP